jgi:hypothetical protein
MKVTLPFQGTLGNCVVVRVTALKVVTVDVTRDMVVEVVTDIVGWDRR